MAPQTARSRSGLFSAGARLACIEGLARKMGGPNLLAGITSPQMLRLIGSSCLSRLSRMHQTVVANTLLGHLDTHGVSSVQLLKFNLPTAIILGDRKD